MTVEKQIRRIISDKGFVCIDEFMRLSMSASDEAYYRSKQPLGESADFITSPEISQMFGEMIGLWCLDVWHKIGKPNPVNILELGPGRGLLMRDLLRGIKNAHSFLDALQIELLDINDLLINEQKQNLSPFAHKIKWLSSFDQISQIPSIIIANEFFDALPIKQYIKIKKEWKEVVIVADPMDGRLKYDRRMLMTKMMISQLTHDHPDAGDGAIVEESAESINIVQSIADHIAKYNGAALIIDYGYDIKTNERKNNQYHSTLQAVKNHKFHPILESSGDVDLSAHVDFNALKAAAKARMTKASKTTEQGQFLHDLGINTRLQQLQKINPDLSDILKRQYERLTSKDQMGSLFKVVTITQT